MQIIDKNMLEHLKIWKNCEMSKKSGVLYINSHNRQLTDATIRKWMYEHYKIDSYGEWDREIYSADNYSRNMSGYYALFSTSGYYILIIEDLEGLSEEPDKLNKMYDSFIDLKEGCDIILVADGDYKDVFHKCEEVVDDISKRINTTEENREMIDIYDQSENPEEEIIKYETPEEEREELEFYWDVVIKQLDKGLFDYKYFKTLYKETLEFFIPRVTKEQVFRKDLWLIEKIGKIKLPKTTTIDGCKRWEYDAAEKFSDGLHRAIINDAYGVFENDNDDFISGQIFFYVFVEKMEDQEEPWYNGGFVHDIVLTPESADFKMDNLALAIRISTYEGNLMKAIKLLEQFSEDEETESDKLKNIPSKE